MNQKPTASRWIAALGAIGIVAMSLVLWSLLETPDKRTAREDPSPAQHRVFSFSPAGDIEIDPQGFGEGLRARGPAGGGSGGLARVAARQWLFSVAPIEAKH